MRAELEAKGERFQTQSDTEVILRLYKREGAAMVPKLRGMFTFAIWDEAKATLFLARDPFGIKPIYYANDGKTFRTASTVKALLPGRRAAVLSPQSTPTHTARPAGPPGTVRARA